MILIPRWNWLDVGNSYEPYPLRLRELFKARVNGVYGIRLKETGEVVYIGESHSNCLYKTLTRHLHKPHRDGWCRYFVVNRSLVEVDWTVMEEKAEILWLEEYLMAMYQPSGNGDRSGNLAGGEASYVDWAETELAAIDAETEAPF